jgi:hypothetical protein
MFRVGGNPVSVRRPLHSRAKTSSQTVTRPSLAKPLLVASALLFVSAPSYAAVYYVHPSGSNTASGKSPGSAWRNINYAVGTHSPVRAGDEIRVAAGIYSENIDIKKSGTAAQPLLIKGVGNVVVKDPSPNSGNGEGVVDIIGVKHVVIENIAVEDAYFYGFAIRGSDSITLRQVRTSNTGASGVFAARRNGIRSSNIKVLNSEVSKSCYIFYQTGQGGQEAISMLSVDGFEIAYNKVYGGRKEGIDAKSSSRNGSIHHNTVSDQARVGIYVDGLGGEARNISVYNNLVYRNAHGIVIGNEGRGHTADVRVYNNVVYSNRNRGISIAAWGPGPDHDIDNVQLVNNTVTKNGGSGILMDNPQATNVLIRNNIAYANAGRTFNQVRVTKGRAVVERNLVTDPRFRNPAWSDFSLQYNSPAIDAGIEAYAPATDFDGKRRPQGAGPDIGAYEVR